MKLAVLGDTHLGVRQDSPVFHDYQRKFYENVFFPRLIENGVTTVIQTGDIFDRRKFGNFNTIQMAREYFFEPFRKHGIKLITYLGNHDIYYKNTLKVNSPELLLGDYILQGVVQVIKTPTTLDFDGVKVDVIPWICTENDVEIAAFIKNTKSQIVFGHFEISGFEMDSGIMCQEGMDRSSLDNYDIVMSGHFHHKSTDGHIWYVGSPCEYTWSDYADPRGFHWFDTETRDLTFIRNPYTIHEKIEFDESKETIETIRQKDFKEYQGKIVKVLVKNKEDPLIFDSYMSRLMEANPHEVNVIENYTESENLDEELAQADSTQDIIKKYIDGLDIGLNKDKLKSIIIDIHNEAQSMGSFGEES